MCVSRLAIGSFLAVVLCSPAIVAQTTTPAAPLTAEQWEEDLDFLLNMLPRKHKNAFFQTTEADFRAAGEALRAQLPQLAEPQRVIGLAKLAAMLHDSHTSLDIRPYARAFHLLPLGLIVLDDGVVVGGATPRYAQWAGAEVLAVGGVPVGEAIERVGRAFPWENAAWKRYMAREFLTIVELLQSEGMADSPEQVRLRLRSTDGQESEVAFDTIPSLGRRQIVAHATQPAGVAAVSLAAPRDGASYWFELLPDTKCLYVRYDRCADDRNKTVARFSDELLERLKADDWERVVFDLRFNSGGNSALLDPLIGKLTGIERLRPRGRFVLLIGRRTFSSGQLNAWKLREKLNPVVMGLPTGQRPNAFGEVKSFELPNSKLRVNYSTKRFQMDPQDRESMFPEIEVAETIADWRAGRDAALEQAVAFREN